MRIRFGAFFAVVVFLAGCATVRESAPPVVVRPFPASPAVAPLNWEEIDKSTQRTKERVLKKQEQPRPAITSTVESGFLPMSEDDYASAKTKAADEIRKANPKMSDSEVDSAAEARAEKEKRLYEQTFRTRSSVSYEWKKTWNW
jgi:hypothetical protein